MKTKLFKISLCAVLLTFVLLPFCGTAASAESYDAVYTNPDTGYRVYILDELDLLTKQEESKLMEDMKPITEYGDIIFWSTNEAASNEIDQAKNKRYEICGDRSSGIFSINMKSRYVTFQSDGDIYVWVTESKADSITDNVSRYAGKGEYYECASEAYAEIYDVIQGNAIAEPMRYISLTVLSLMAAFVLVVGVVFLTRLNPLARRNRQTAILTGSGEMFVKPPVVKMISSRTRGWVTALLVILRIVLEALAEGIGSGGSSSGGGKSSGGGSSGGGGGGGSSRF